MNGYDTYLDELASICREFPGFKTKPKAQSWLCKIINVLLWVLTLGKTEFMDRYVTVLGKTMYTPTNWDQLTWSEKWVVLRHEGVHLRQADRMFFGWAFWVGWTIWAFCYLFVLPFGLTLRARWEREAYAESYRSSQRCGRKMSRARLFREFTGPNYFWMDLRREYVSKWLDQMGVSD